MSAAQILGVMSERLHARSVILLAGLERRLPRVLAYWLILATLASSVRVLASTQHSPLDVRAVLPYLLLVLAPAASLVFAMRWFDRGHLLPQPETRLAVVGSWRSLRPTDAMRHPMYGTTGIMVSLLIGMLLNVPVRAAEYLGTLPAVSAASPKWLSTLHMLMTADVVLLSSLYVICFAAALRRVPLFPRMLVAVWCVDMVMQLGIAFFAAREGMPPLVGTALGELLNTNIKKVFISVALWLPYLMLSTRVNVTYRHRIPD